MSERLQILRSQFHAMRLAVLVIIGAVLNMLILTSVTWYATLSGLVLGPPEQVSLIPLYIGYFAFGIVYSLVVSLNTKPKIVVPPVYMQTATGMLFIFVIIVVVTSVYPQGVILNEEQREQISNILSGMLGFIVIVGIAQHVVAKEILGLSGSKENLELKSYSVNAPFNTIAQAISDPHFQSKFDLSLKISEDRFIVLTSKRNADSGQVLVLVPNENTQTECILSTASYEVIFDNYFNTPEARADKELIFGAIERASGAEINETSNHHNSLRQAESYALERTRSPLAALRDAPRRYLFSLGGLFGLGIAFTIAYAVTGNDPRPVIDSSALISAWVVLAVAIITEVLHYIKDKGVKPRHS